MKPITALAFVIAIPSLLAPLACGDSKFEDAERARATEPENDAGVPAADADIDVIPIVGAPPGCDPNLLPKDNECVVHESTGVFVSSSMGSPTGDGSRAKPFNTLEKALSVAQGTGRRVYACAETYEESVLVPNGARLFGHLDCKANWAVAPTKRATIKGKTSPAVDLTQVMTAVRIDSFEIIAPDAAMPGASSIGLRVTESTADVLVVSSEISAGKGAAGTTLGAAPPQLTQGASINGGDSKKTDPCSGNVCLVTFKPGSGGANNCGSGISGGTGGSGGYGERGFRNDANALVVTYSAQAGGGGTATTAAGASPDVQGKGADGVPPADGANGASSSGGTFTKDGYVAGDGARGQDGQPGQGGGGGAGGKLYVSEVITKNITYWSASGAGGGAGGCPGLATQAGGGGGASIGLYSWNANVILDGTKVVASTGGGGHAGSFGTSPTYGGTGGADVYPQNFRIHLALRGGDGSRGGLAGTSGHGAGGPSIGIAYKGKQPTMTGSTAEAGAGGPGQAASSTDLVSKPRPIAASTAGASKQTYAIP